ncbi:MAG: hypothetical protein EOM29_09515 [Bacteroidia bacterium]|nr:hypothetical protein [Bacteroidia bacterium]
MERQITFNGKLYNVFDNDDGSHYMVEVEEQELTKKPYFDFEKWYQAEKHRFDQEVARHKEIVGKELQREPRDPEWFSCGRTVVHQDEVVWK